MAPNLYVGITDRQWFELLSASMPLDEVNFWSPSGRPFRSLSPGELFLFKLHAPDNFIVGWGVFAHDLALPCSLAWETFGIANGARNFAEMRARIARYRRVDPALREDFVIGCRVLTQPSFLAEKDWIPAPSTWAREIVQGKTYSVDELKGRRCGRPCKTDRRAQALYQLASGTARLRSCVPDLARAPFGCSSRTPIFAGAR